MFHRALVWLSVLVPAISAEVRAGVPAAGPANHPFNLEQRVLWTGSNVRGTPDPPPPYIVEQVWPKLRFDNPLELARAPDSDRLFVLEYRGKLWSFLPGAEKADLVHDLGKLAYGMTCHPRYADNRYIYVTYILHETDPLPNGTRVSRFTVSDTDPPTVDPASEVVMIEWLCGGHNGGCLQFGPDGYLYIATGDGSGIADEHQTGQDLTDLLGSILRIDVDHAAGDKPYRVPADNPFVGVEGARPEVFAYGLRQPWKFNFDTASGQLWAGEVGQDLWEMVHLIKKGANYGWSTHEGSHPFRPARRAGPTPVTPPVLEHSHTLFRSVTGGYVYHGRRLPELAGAYIYGDFDTGKVWSLVYQDGQVQQSRELADTNLRLIDFVEDKEGELYLLDYIGGIYRLAAAPPPEDLPPFPRKLSQTGLFADTPGHVPAAGLIPYSVNAALWSDGAEKERFLAIPGDGQIEFDTMTYPQPAPGAPPGWKFPDGTVLIKTFSIDLEPGNPASRHRLETRILHHKRLTGDEVFGDQVWHGYTYVWNDDQTDADLLGADGLDRVIQIADASAPGGRRQQTWHFPSRAECTLCHTMPAKYVLGFNTLQLNKDHDYGGVVANQIKTLAKLGLFKNPPDVPPAQLPRLADYTDKTASLRDRARAYMHANCAHCHRKWGGGNAEFQLLSTLPLEELGIVDTRPGHGSFEMSDARILVPGEPDRSLIHARMGRLGLGRMPHVASLVVDEEGMKLVGDWIRSLEPAGSP